MPLVANFGSFSENFQISSIIKKLGQKDRTLLLFIHLSSLCTNYHIISCIKQILLTSTTRSFPVSSKSCLQVLPCHFPYQANHTCKCCTTMSFPMSSKSCVSVLPYPFRYQANHMCKFMLECYCAFK